MMDARHRAALMAKESKINLEDFGAIKEINYAERLFKIKRLEHESHLCKVHLEDE